MELLTDDVLMETYFNAKQLRLESAFICLIEEEIRKRGLIVVKQEGEHKGYYCKQIIQFISSGESLQKTLDTLLRYLDTEFINHSVGSSIHLYNRTENRLDCISTHSLPESMVDEIGQMEIGPYNGAIASAAFFQTPHHVEDLEKDSDNLILLKYPFTSMYVFPFLATNKELLGTLTLFFRKPSSYTTEKLKNKLNMYLQLAAIASELIEVTCHQVKNPPKQQWKYSKEEMQLALSNGEFEVYYQPYFLVNRSGFGLEALIRWNHPQYGVLNPGAFLSIAEENGFIYDLEPWVLNEGLKDMKNLHENGLTNIPVSVNISAQQFEDPHFYSNVKKLLKRYAYPPKLLTLEITERFLIQSKTLESFLKLKDLGVRISIDDFGTAYSSLQYLNRIPADELKIDRSFILNMEEDVNKQKIIEMIIMLGHQLQLEIVAEGVETERQLHLLKQMNCDRVQGFLFCKPSPLHVLKPNELKNKLLAIAQ